MKDNDPQNEVKSLAGRIDKAGMGQKSTKTKPKKDITKKKKKDTPLQINKERNLLQQKFDDTLLYLPRTKENKLVYEQFLGKIYSVIQDQPQQTLLSIADQILALLKNQSSDVIEKQAEMTALFGQKIPHQLFLDLANIAKLITDYKLEEQQERLQEGMIIEESEEDDRDEDSEGAFEEQEQVIQEQIEQKIQTSRSMVKKQESQANKKNLDPNIIDAHWLHSQLCKYYDPQISQNLQKQIMKILQSSSKIDVENNLLELLNYEKFDLIKLLLENKKIIYYCTKYHQTQNEKQKQQILEEMKLNDIVLDRKTRKNKSTTQQKPKNMDVQEKQFQLTNVKDQEINRLTKKIIDLTIHDSTDRINNKQEYKFKLPTGAQKIDKPGYEEIKIPPKIHTFNENLIQFQQLPKWMQPAFTGLKRFNIIQSHVFNHALKSNKNMLVCAPTSAGKTNIAVLTIMQVLDQYRNVNGFIDTSKFKIVYIAPMKALVAEITGNLHNRLKELNITVKQLTGDMHLSKGQIQETQIIVSTPQKWDIITRKAGDRLFTEQVKLLIIDEIHLLGDSRGPVLESIIARTVRQEETTLQHVRIIGLSATLPNYNDVGALLRIKNKEGIFYFDQSYRPIPLQQLYVGVTQKKGVRKMMMINQILYEKVIQRVANYQMIIFVHSRRDTVRTANLLKQTAYSKDQSHKILHPDSESKRILQAIIQQQNEKINSKDLKSLLSQGIGIHHAGLSRGDRDLVEQLFADKHLNILVSTATLAWGVNLPAHTVIIKGTQVYSPEQGRWIELSLQDVMQMLGRAGRPRYDKEGEGIIITGYEQVRYYLGLLNMQIPLQSQLTKTLPDQLNAQIVLGTITTLKQAVQWLAYTYLFIRMLKNSKYYSITLQQLQQDPQLLKRRVNLIHTALTILQRNGLVNYDRKNGNVSSTFLGKIASHYYIKYPSMAMYNSNLKNNLGLIELFKIFSMSIEFKYVTVREQQKTQLQKLVQSVPVPIKGSIQESTTKISALLQANISKLQLDGYALNVDKVYITQSASRIMRCLFQICLKRGWGQVAQRTLQLSKMIDKSMWSCMNPLRQFQQIPGYVISRLEKKQQFSWQSFYQMNPQQIGDLTKFPKLGKILHKFIHYVPRLQLDAYALPITKSCLKIDLTVKVDFKWQDQFHGKQQPFWLMVFDCNEENILYSYYFTINKNQENYYLQFIVPLFQIMHPLYFIKVISDRWICADNVLPLSFKNMILPSKFPAPTEVLDLQPYPVSHLGTFSKQKQFQQLKIHYLNQIQTQVYQSFINSNNNIFLGASQGSGKFTLTIFAINKCIQNKQKCVIMFPHKAVMNNRFQFVRKLFHKVRVSKTLDDRKKDPIVLKLNDIVLTTPGAWEIVTRNWKKNQGFKQIGLFVIENLHMLHENYSLMQVAISRMRAISSQIPHSIRIIGLSASLADYKDVAQWIGASPENTFNFHPSVRQNSVEIIFNTYDQHIREARIHNIRKNILNSIKHYNRNAIVFVNDKRQARLNALDFVSLISTDDIKLFKKNQNIKMQRVSTDQYLLHVMQHGVAYIYQGMNQIEKKHVIQLFKVGNINLLLVSHSLKWQLECKAFIIAVLDCNIFDCKIGRWSYYSIPQIIQIMSFAEISELDKLNKHKSKQLNSAKLIIYCQSSLKTFYKKFLFQPYPIESSLNNHLNNHLNTAISIKNIQSKQDCIDWLTWTFMYRRLTQNPNYYNMQQVSQTGISSYLSQLIENSVEYLENIKCVEVEDQINLSATNLGIIAAYYNIKISTLSRFVEKTLSNIKINDILQLICEAQQLEHISYRPKQYQTIGQLMVPINKKPINKVHALLLLYFHRINIPTQFAYELKQILPIALLLTKALVDIISSFGYLKSLIFTMQFSQMIVQGMWVTDSPLLQIMPINYVNKLKDNYNVKNINDFINMDDDSRGKALQGADINRIAQLCNRYPFIDMNFKIKQKDQLNVELQVVLERQEALDTNIIMSSFYPEEKQQEWWVLVGQKKNNRVLTTKKITIKEGSKSVKTTLMFQMLEDTNKYTLYAICDSYIDCYYAEEIQVEIQPQQE